MAPVRRSGHTCMLAQAAGEGAAQNENYHLGPPLQLITSADWKHPIFYTYSQMHSGKKL